VWTWARADVPRTFNARRDAVLRAYQYVLCDDQLDVSAMQEAANLLPGVHNFRNFSLEKRQSAVRTIFSSDVYESGGFIVVEVAADSFVWKMMRKLVSAIALVGKAQRSVEWFGKMLNPDAYAEGIRSAPASGLILARVEYDGIDFQEDAYAKKKARGEVQKALLQNILMAQVLKKFNERMGGSTAYQI
jgi:tRNA pseudouridine38-40 synthase